MMAELKSFSEPTRKLVASVGSAVTRDEIDSYGKLQSILDRTRRLETILETWKEQQTQDRKLRATYAFWLMVFMALQALVINVVYVLMGFGVLTFDEWTARTFIMGVFAEIIGLVLIVVRYLFRAPEIDLSQLLQEKGAENER